VSYHRAINQTVGMSTRIQSTVHSLSLGNKQVEQFPTALSATVRCCVWSLMFMGPCIVNVFLNTTNEMQRYTIFFIVISALHVSSGKTAQNMQSTDDSKEYCITLHLIGCA
jgi:hypothetical protein